MTDDGLVEKNLSYDRASWASKAYNSIKYLMERAKNGKDPYTHYTFEEIRKEGGVCRDQAYYAANTAKVMGIPAVYAVGDGDRGPHAWVVSNDSETQWNQINSYGYKTGTYSNPCSGRRHHESMLLLQTKKSVLFFIPWARYWIVGTTSGAIAGAALFLPVLILVPAMVYFVNGARTFGELFWQMTAVLMIMTLFDRIFIDWYWVGRTKAWIIPGTEDLMPYIPRKTMIGKWVGSLVGFPLIAAILAAVMTLLPG